MLSRCAHTAAATLMLVATAQGAGESGPRQIVDRLNAVMAGVLREAAQLGYAGRFARLAPAVEAASDLDFMGEKALGRHWKDLDEGQRTQWRTVFHEFTIANYAANLDRDTGQRFEVVDETPDAHDTVLVRGRVVEPAKESMDLSYRLHRTPEGWRIIDLQVKGTVSELALRRADFTSVVARDGFDALVTTVRGRIADLAAGRGKSPAA